MEDMLRKLLAIAASDSLSIFYHPLQTSPSDAGLLPSTLTLASKQLLQFTRGRGCSPFGGDQPFLGCNISHCPDPKIYVHLKRCPTLADGSLKLTKEPGVGAFDWVYSSQIRMKMMKPKCFETF
jgi:hypothetical protein